MAVIEATLGPPGLARRSDWVDFHPLPGMNSLLPESLAQPLPSKPANANANARKPLVRVNFCMARI